MHCPKCGQPLRDIEYEAVSIDTCDSCGGEVLGPDAIRHIVTTRDEKFPAELRAAMRHREPMFGVPGHERDRSLNCPNCQSRMSVVNYGGDSGFFVDRCDRCETMFLDHEELEKIQAAMEHWKDEAPAKIGAIADELERRRREVADSTNRAFSGSRFAFVNAVINRLLDAA